MHRSLALTLPIACVAAALMLAGRTPAQPPASSGAAPGPAGAPAAGQPVSADTGYSVGFDVGREVRANMQRDGVSVSPDAMIRGFTDALRGTAPAISDAAMAKALEDLQHTVDEREVRDRLANDPVFRAAAEQAAARSKEFLEKFAKRPGVKALPGGIVYEVVRAGTGDPVRGAPSVVATYQTYLSSGELVTRGEGVTVRLEDLVPGAREAASEMRVGDRWYIAVPPELAFGAHGRPPRVGPNEVILADVTIDGVGK